MTLFPFLDLGYRIIDTSAFVSFSGADFAEPGKYVNQREAIWLRIEELICEGKLKTVPEVWGELGFVDPPSQQRLEPLKDKLLLKREELQDVYNLVLEFGHKLLNANTYTPGREPADPPLLVHAFKYNVPIINSEKPIEERKGQRKGRKLCIPDVCKLKGKSELSIPFEKFLCDEGLIP